MAASVRQPATASRSAGTAAGDSRNNVARPQARYTAVKYAPFCFCTVVDHKALQALLEMTAGGAYRDNHPWLVAAEMLADAQARDEIVVLMLATLAPAAAPDTAPDTAPAETGLAATSMPPTLTPGVLEFAYWTTVSGIEVNRFRQGSESRVAFGALLPVNELWAPIDSMQLLPSSERLRREELESLRASRQALDEHSLHPYAICTTPPFVLARRGPPDEPDAPATPT